VDTASKRKDNKALKWILECEQWDTVTDEQLDLFDRDASHRRFALLNKRLSTQLLKVAQSNSSNVPLLGTRILQSAEAALKEGRTLGGRVILRTVFRYYKPHDMAVEYYRVTDITGLKVVDGNLEAFQIQWNKWLSGLKAPLASTWLEPWYYAAVMSHKGIAIDIATYERLPESSGGDRSYEFLVAAVNAYVERQRKKRMTEALTKGLGAAKPAAVGKKTKGDGKGKSKSPKGEQPGGKGPKGGQPAKAPKGGQPGKGNAPPGPAKAKTPCIFFPKGTCKYGKACEFQHDPKKANPKPGKGGGKAAGKTGLTEEAKASIPCKSYANGNCKFADKCHYSHAAPAADPPKGKGAQPTVVKKGTGGPARVRPAGNAFGTTLMKMTTLASFVSGMAASATDRPVKRWWLQDTGTGYDLTSKSKVPKCLRKDIEEAEVHLILDTANGTTVAKEVVPMQIGVLQENIEPHLLEETPDVMTVGRRCQEYGYGFAWDPFSDQPYYTKPDGKGGWDGDVVPLYAFDYSPYLPDFDNDVCESTDPLDVVAVPATESKPLDGAPDREFYERLAYDQPEAADAANGSDAVEAVKASLADAEKVISELLGTHGGVRPADHWVSRDGQEVRVHEKWRKALFTPAGVKGAPNVDTLSDERITFVQYDDGKVENTPTTGQIPKMAEKSWTNSGRA